MRALEEAGVGKIADGPKCSLKQVWSDIMNLETSKASSYRWTATIVGILFIIGTASGILSLGFLETTIGTLDLSKISANENQVLIGALLIFIMAAACVGTTFWMYPVLRKYSEALALGAVGFRLIEGVLMVITAVCMLVLLTLSQEFVRTGAADSSYFQTFGVIIQAGSNWIANVPIPLAWFMAALMYYYIFYRTKLIPRWLTAWGIIGVTLGAAAGVLGMFGVLDTSMATQILMNAPIIPQEIVMGIWLIVKGFDQSAIASMSAGTDIDNAAMTVKPKIQMV